MKDRTHLRFFILTLFLGVFIIGNQAYGAEPIAKITGIKLCESYNRQYGTNYRSIMPTNLYGPNDNFHPENSHVVPSLIRKFHFAKVNNQDSVEVWGTGKPKREFLHVDDMASASVFIMNLDEAIYGKHTQAMLSHINVGTGIDLTIHELAELTRDVTGYSGTIRFNLTLRINIYTEFTARRTAWICKIKTYPFRITLNTLFNPVIPFQVF